MLTYETVVNALNNLNIQYDGRKLYKNKWLPILCPLHGDKNYGNANIDITTGIISCFACNQSIHIINLAMQHYGCRQMEAIKILFGFIPDDIKTNPINPTVHDKREKEREKLFIGITIPLDPTKYQYTQNRGYTKEFINHFNIVHSVSEPYCDYMILPIIDKQKDINIFEARKLMKNERAIQVFGSVEEFEKQGEEHGWRWDFKEQKAKDKDGKIVTIPFVDYLVKPKVLYPSNTPVSETIFNIDNLDRNKDLILTEGTGSLPKIWHNITKNCTCLFGAKISEEQLKYLDEFERIYYIPDKDEAGALSVEFLHTNLKEAKLKVFDIDKEDTDPDFIEVLNEDNLVDPMRYIIRNLVCR